jgi:hypothetical protein
MSKPEYNVLLFGDFEPEIVRLSKLFDPERDEFQLVTSDEFNPDWIYYTAEVRNKTLYFTRAEEDEVKAAAAAGTLANNYWHGPDRDVDEDGENGKYVPAPKSIVIVDPESSKISTGRWGTYTLLIVESVDPVSFKSTLVPINFTGDIDNATRAVDYQNDKLMLYFDEVTTVGGHKVTSLVPDRKLMMYGHTALKYRILKGNEIISTNEIHVGGVSSEPRFIRYVPANGSKFTITAENYKTLVGKFVEYYNSVDTRVRVQVTAANVEMFKSFKEVYILGNTDDTLNNVQLPPYCYLKSGAVAPIAGDNYTFEVYEDDIAEEPIVDKTTGAVTGYKEVGVNRLILSVHLTAQPASPLKSLDETNAVITGFGVNYLNDEGGIEDGDVWKIASGSTRADIITRMDPYILLNDGSVQHVPVSLLGATLFDYGLDQIPASATVGAEYDVLFKYYPVTAEGVDSTNLIDVLYKPAVVQKAVTDEDGKTVIVPVTPSPIQLYFVKLDDGSMEAVGYGDEVRAFDPSKAYYVKRSDLDWTKVVVGASRKFMNCHRRIRIVEASFSNPRVIVPVPVDKNNGYPFDKTTGYDIGFLVYDHNYESPVLLEAKDPRIGFVSSGKIVSGDEADAVRPDGDKVGTKQSFSIKYRSSAVSPWKTFAQPTEMTLAEMNDSSSPLKWLIKFGGNPNVYGSNDVSAGKVRPFVWFEWAKEQYFIDPMSFPDKETMLNNFYFPVVGSDAVVPTHFRLRSVDFGSKYSISDEVSFASDSEIDPLSISQFHTRITRKAGVGLQPLNTSGSTPDEANGKVIGTVLVEFFNKVSDNQYLVAVPVEVRLFVES